MFIDRALGYLADFLKRNESQLIKFKDYEKAIIEAEGLVKEELDFEKEMERAEKLSDLIYESSSAFYIPYYYKKYATKNTIIREFIEGVTIDNTKGLKEMGLSTQQAFIYILGEVHRILSRHDLLSPKLSEQSVLIRKYIKPAQRK
jgi:predicted unusual protein kinase regulating ubiquinone biosynthesis (AarF/ABC1/UbiB family)